MSEADAILPVPIVDCIQTRADIRSLFIGTTLTLIEFCRTREEDKIFTSRCLNDQDLGLMVIIVIRFVHTRTALWAYQRKIALHSSGEGSPPVACLTPAHTVNILCSDC